MYFSERILYENIAPWWVQYSLDMENGGFKLHYTDNNTYLGDVDKDVVMQARTVCQQ